MVMEKEKQPMPMHRIKIWRLASLESGSSSFWPNSKKTAGGEPSTDDCSPQPLESIKGINTHVSDPGLADRVP